MNRHTIERSGFKKFVVVTPSTIVDSVRTRKFSAGDRRLQAEGIRGLRLTQTRRHAPQMLIDFGRNSIQSVTITTEIFLRRHN